MLITAGGTVGLENGALDLTALVTFRDTGLQKFQSPLVRDILSKGVRLPIRGTLMNPEFDKESFLKPLARTAGKKILEEKLGDLLFQKLGKP